MQPIHIVANLPVGIDALIESGKIWLILALTAIYTRAKLKVKLPVASRHIF